MAVGVKSSSSRSQQWLFRKVSKADLELLSFTQENAQNTGILRVDLIRHGKEKTD